MMARVFDGLRAMTSAPSGGATESSPDTAGAAGRCCCAEAMVTSGEATQKNAINKVKGILRLCTSPKVYAKQDRFGSGSSACVSRVDREEHCRPAREDGPMIR